MRIGVVGCGYWGEKHVRVLDGLGGVRELWAIDRDAGRREAIGRRHTTVRTAADLGETLEQLDAVVIATPTRFHVELAAQALRAGKDVLVEKPLALHVADAEALTRLAEDNDRLLMVGHTFEYNPAVWALRDLVAGGHLGDLCFVDLARLNLGPYRSDVNVMWDMAPHDVAILNHVVGSLPETVQAWGEDHAGVGLEDVVHLRLCYPGGQLTANIQVSWLYPSKVRRVTAVGTRGMAVFDDMSAEEPLRIFDKAVSVGGDGEAPVSYHVGGMRAPFVAAAEPLRLELEHFVRCVFERTTPRTDGRNGADVVRVLEAAQRSLHSGRPEPVTGPGDREVTAAAAVSVGRARVEVTR
jgi:predicted dehydrogenase